jgi:hypothetical protein
MDQAVDQPRRKIFPPRHALVNPIACNAFAMRFLKEEKLSNVGPNTGVQKSYLDVMNTQIKVGSENLLKAMSSTQICDAILVRRPYARIIEGDPDVVGVLKFQIDGETVAEGAIRKFLIKGMNDPILDEPFAFAKTECLFNSGRLEDKGKGEVAVLDEPTSIFMPNGSQVYISARDVSLPDGKTVQIEVGFLAATYTTKDMGTPYQTYSLQMPGSIDPEKDAFLAQRAKDIASIIHRPKA